MPLMLFIFNSPKAINNHCGTSPACSHLLYHPCCHPASPAQRCDNTKQTGCYCLHCLPISALRQSVPPHTHRYVPLMLAFFSSSDQPPAPLPLGGQVVQWCWSWCCSPPPASPMSSRLQASCTVHVCVPLLSPPLIFFLSSATQEGLLAEGYAWLVRSSYC